MAESNALLSQLMVEVFYAEASPSLRVSQEYVEIFYAAEGDLLVSQEVVEIFYAADVNIQISQEVIEIFGASEMLLEATGILALSGILAPISTGTNPLQNWIVNPIAKKIYLVRLEVKWIEGDILQKEFIYLSNFAYNTHPDEDPPNTEYITVLQDENIPPFSQQLSETFYGISIPSFGQLIIPNVQGIFDSKLPPNRVWDGGEILIKLTGDRQELQLMFAPIILIGKMRMNSWGDNQITVDTFSRHTDIDTKNIAEETFLGVNEESVVIPVPYGYCNNVTPKIKDSFALIYKVAGRAIYDILFVYDDGVALSEGQFVRNLLVGEFTLLVNPVGLITCDVVGIMIDGVFSASRGDFIVDALITYAGFSPADINMESVLNFKLAVPYDSGIYIENPLSVLDFITKLLYPVLGFMTFDRFGFINLGVLTLPDAVPIEDVDIVVNEKNILPVSGSGDGDKSLAQDMYSISVWKTVIKQIILFFYQIITVQEAGTLGGGAPVDPGTPTGITRRELLSKEWRRFPKDNPLAIGPNPLYQNATTIDAVETFMFHPEEVAIIADQWVELLGVNRRIITTRIKILPVRKTIGAIVDFTHGQYEHLQGVVISYAEDYAKSTVTLGVLV